MAAYLDYDTYTDMGGSAHEASFARLELKARQVINHATHFRIANEEPVREAVRMCMFELIEAQSAAEQAGGMPGRDVAAMSNDGVSVTFANSASGDSGAKQRAAIITAWLAGEATADGVSLLYAGVDA